MHDYSDDDLRAARAPIASLISKSEKAQQKLAPNTWQYAMLQSNLTALHLASALMYGGAGDSEAFPPSAVREALNALEAMIDRTEKAAVKFAPGTSQHTLLENRLRALRIAGAFMKAELERG